ncbi:hypothetical protein RB195_023964 [Necator americanus]|uniref:Uncharacterized protein n=1 Tax=Necator americanus TaxID=51031 RepID=A0ABR1ELE7_NECAM
MNPQKLYALLKQYSRRMERCLPVLNTANGVPVGGATLLIWREHFNSLWKDKRHRYLSSSMSNDQQHVEHVQEAQVCSQTTHLGKDIRTPTNDH